MPPSSSLETAPPIWTACERLLAPQVDARLQRHAALARAEERAQARIKALCFVDTRPTLIRSEAFAEDLQQEPRVAVDAGLARTLMRGLAGVAAPRALA